MSQQLLNQAGVFTYNAMNALNALLASQGIVTQGNVWWVRPGTGVDSLAAGGGQTPASAFKTLTFALAQATANQNDVVLLCAESNTAGGTTDYQSSVLTWNKDLVHLIGINAGSFCSPRSRVSNAAASNSFANLFTLSANGCLISGIEFFQGKGATTLSAAQTAVTVSGSRNVFVNCAISGIGDSTLDYAGSNSLTVTGDDTTFINCYIGLDTQVRGTAATYEVSIAGTAARTRFVDCEFASYANSTSWRAVSIGANVDRFVKFIRPVFAASVGLPGVAIPAGVFSVSAMNGQVQVVQPALFGYGLLASGGSTLVKVLAYQNATTVQGVGASAASS